VIHLEQIHADSIPNIAFSICIHKIAAKIKEDINGKRQNSGKPRTF